MSRYTLGVLAALAVAGLLVVRVLAGAALAPRATGRLSSTLTLVSPGKTAALAQLTYTGLAGSCLGQTFSQGPKTVPAGGAAQVAPGAFDDKLLPAGCLAAARVEAIRGDTLVLVTTDDGGAGNPPGRWAAYAARSVGGRTGSRAGLPRLAGGALGPGLVAATNAGTASTDLALALTDEAGKAIACPECSRKLGAGETALFDTRLMPSLAGQKRLAGVLGAGAPLAVAVAELDPDEKADLAAYGVAPVPGAPPERLPLALNRQDGGGSELYVLDLDPALPASAVLDLQPQAGGAAIPLALPLIAPGAAARSVLAQETRLPAGAFAAAASGDRALALAGLTEWSPGGGRALEWSAEAAVDVVAPLVMKSAGGRTARVTILNPDPASRAPLELELVALGASTPTFTLQLVLPPRLSVTLDLATDPRLANLPEGFVGSLRARSQVPVALSVALYASSGAVAAYEGQSAASSALVQLAPLVWSAWAPDQPTPTASHTPRASDTHTPTATRPAAETDTPTPAATRPTGGTVTPSATATEPARDTATPTATRQVPPTRTPTPRPSGPAEKRSWTRYTTANSDLPDDAVHYVEAEATVVWLRTAGSGGGADRTVRVLSGAWTTYPSQELAVEENLALGFIRTLRDFWVLDSLDRAWVGPRYYDRVRWTDVTRNETQVAGGTMTYETRGLIDPLGQAALPFDVTTDCMGSPMPCTDTGLRGYSLAGPTPSVVYDLRLESSTDAGQYGLPRLHLVPGGSGATVFAAPAGRRPAAGPAQAGQAYAVSQSALYVLPNATPISYPFLDPEAGLRNAGYATAATLDDQGRLVVFTWVEAHAPPPARDLSWHVYMNVWTGGGWQIEELTASPLFNGDAQFDRVTAAAYCGGALWMTSYAGAVVTLENDAWVVTASPGEGDVDFSGVVDLACDADGGIWMATSNGVLHGLDGTVAVPVPMYLPYTQQKR